NVGAGTLEIDSITGTSEYVVSDISAMTVASGASITFVVTFTPSAVGTSSGNFVTVVSNSTTTPDMFPLCGEGICADFGTVALGLSSDVLSIPIYNWRGSTLTIASITPSNPNVVVSDACGAIAAGYTCTFGLTWTPTVDGEAPGTVTIVSDAADSPWVLEL